MWRLSRYIPRKVWHTLLYVLFALVLIAFFTTFPMTRSRQFRSSGGADKWNFEMLNASDFLNLNNDHLVDDLVGDPFIAYRNLPKRDYFDVDAYNREQQRDGPGERGAAVKLSDLDDSIAKKRDELYRQNGYDAYVSDQLALNRSVKDIRHKSCRGIKHIERLPSVSVIFPFHNEHFSTLLRSVYSVINRSPPGIVREVILIDDASTKEFLKQPLEEYWMAQRMDHIVKVVRTSKREGLIRARLVGAKAATSDILIFLDAHSEANYNWLPPLIEPIAMDYRTVVCPFVDVIDCDTYEYRAQDEGARGSFDWEFNYKRLPLTDDDLKHPSRPFESPVMAGGYFAISAKWFWELGGYDEGLDIWGGEQYELSFKIWQCHGRLVDAPCSRVGHIYRCKYIPFPNPNVGDFISRNYRRVAEVWMEEYKNFLFDRKPLLKSTDPGNLDKQREVRTRLKCKSFDWFMQNVAFDQNEFYPAVEPLEGAEGRLKNDAIGKCVDANFGKSGDRVKLSECESASEEKFHYTFHEDIRPHGRTMCFDVSSSVERAPVTLFACHGMRGNQYFKYLPKTKQLHQHTSNMCMNGDATTGEVFMITCDPTSPTQRWTWTTLRVEVLEEWEREKKRKAEAKRVREARFQ